MFDATKLLGGFLQGRHGGATGGLGGMVGQALSGLSRGGAPGGGGGLGGVVGQLVNQVRGSGTAAGQPQAPGQGGGGFMDQVGDMVRRATEAPGAELRNNNPAAVGGAGALAGALMGGGRGALGGGLLAVLGSLAYAAYQKNGAAGRGGSAPASFLPAGYADPAEVQRKAGLVLRAMIQATKADGQLDDAERERLTRHLRETGDDREAEAFLRDEMARPVDMEGLVAQVRSPEEGAEVYAASLMAISVDTQAERDYLARLAAALRLPEGVVSHIQGSLPRAA